MNPIARSVMAIAVLVVGSLANAYAAKEKQQVVKPPVSQAWVDVATFSGMGMPGMGMGGGGMNPMAMLGGIFGGGVGKNTFGNTETGLAGSWMDVTLYTRDNPNLNEAIQAVPSSSKLAPTLHLVSPKSQKSPPPVHDDDVVKEDFRPPKGKMYLYWGCGDTIRAGQPRVLDMSKAGMDDYQKFFVSRRATQRGAHLAVGRPAWPNEQDARVIPDGASLVGEHAFQGQGVPDGFKFNIGANQDFMPAIDLHQHEMNGTTLLEWKTLPTARAYFITAMGARGGDENEMVFWTSSDVPEIGTGLMDYQTNPAVDRWLKEKVLLTPDTRTCTVPKGIFGEGAMLRMIAYGSELNLAHPPRPSDPRIAWEPKWASKIRVKSVASAMLGMEEQMAKSRPGQGDAMGNLGRDYSSTSSASDKPKETSPTDGIGQGLNKLKGLFGW